MAQTQTPSDISTTLSRIAELSGLSESEVATMYAQAQKGATLAEMFHIPTKSLEAGYTLACNLFNSGRLQDAETMFRALCQYDDSNARNWIGLGCCLEKLAEYREAAFCFAHAAELGHPMQPKPLYLLAQCYLSIQDKEAARRVLNMAVTIGKASTSDSEQSRYLHMAHELLATLAQE